MRSLAIVLAALTAAACGAEGPTSVQGTARPASSAALSPTPTEVTPSAFPISSPTGELRWNPLGAIADARFGRAVGFDAGYVVIDGSPTIWFSPDGVDWRPVPAPLLDGVVVGLDSVASDGARVLVVGRYSPCLDFTPDLITPACRFRPISWVSDDGTTWRSSGFWTGPIGPEDGGSAFEAAWSVPAGGWDAAQVLHAGDEFVGEGPALWHSDDGQSWFLLRGLPPAAECDAMLSAGYFWGVADADGRRVAREVSPCDGTVYLSTSTDGQRYERLETFPGTGEWIGEGLAPVDSGPWMFLAGGYSLARAGLGDWADGSEAVVWASADLLDWTTSVLPVPPDTVASVVTAVAHGAARYVATGRARGPGTVPLQAITWLSPDGTTWRLADARPATDESPFIDAAVDGPAGMVGLACGDRDCEAGTTVWRLDDVR
jgi:hypothetical protein